VEPARWFIIQNPKHSKTTTPPMSEQSGTSPSSSNTPETGIQFFIKMAPMPEVCFDGKVLQSLLLPPTQPKVLAFDVIGKTLLELPLPSTVTASTTIADWKKELAVILRADVVHLHVGPTRVALELNYDDDAKVLFQSCIRPFLGGFLPIRLQVARSSTLTIDACVSDSIDSLKARLHHLIGIHPDLQRLIFAGTLLMNGGNLHRYGISTEATVHLMPRIGCRWTSTTTTAIDTNHAYRGYNATYDTHGRRYEEGLNVEGVCTACNQAGGVVLPFGYGTFERLREQSHCPKCNQLLTITSFGLVGAYIGTATGDWQYFDVAYGQSLNVDLPIRVNQFNPDADCLFCGQDVAQISEPLSASVSVPGKLDTGCQAIWRQFRSIKK